MSTPATRGKGMALIGVAFSLGFLFGPMIGAAFAIWGRDQTGEWYMYPAVLALILSIVDVMYLAVFFKVTALLILVILNIEIVGIPAGESAQ